MFKRPASERAVCARTESFPGTLLLPYFALRLGNILALCSDAVELVWIFWLFDVQGLYF